MSTLWTRRQLLGAVGAAASLSAIPVLAAAEQPGPRRKPIPGGGTIPVIGMGTWQTFNVGRDPELRDARTEVLRSFFEHGGGMVDSSPMYGSAAAVMGHALDRLGHPEALFSAEKVWTRDGDATRTQVDEQASAWRVQRFDLMQVHNLLAWPEHLEALRAMKAAGDLGHVGITTSHGRRHDELERVMQREPLDFVQLTYNLTHRAVEQRLLPLAREKGIAVIANRPYDGGRLIKGLQDRAAVPDWAREEFGCRNWADFLLRFIVSHPAVTCAIPATTRVEHMQENMRAGAGPLPDAELRERMIRHVEAL